MLIHTQLGPCRCRADKIDTALHVGALHVCGASVDNPWNFDRVVRRWRKERVLLTSPATHANKFYLSRPNTTKYIVTFFQDIRVISSPFAMRIGYGV